MRLILGTLFLVLVIALAWWRGGGPERVGATLLFAVFCIDRAGHIIIGRTSWATLDTFHLFLDLATLAGLVAILIKAWRLWPVWACACQLLSVLSHPLRMLKIGLHPLIQSILGIFPFYLILISLLLGTVLHQRRILRSGSDRSWRN